ncbi:MAG: N-acetyl-gamma-glutamyl-phosphate reductase [Endomicrobiia bacterium]
MKKIGIVGISGVTSVELIKILSFHSKVEVEYLLSSSASFQEFEHFKNAYGLKKAKFLSTSDNNFYKEITNNDVDLLFLCLPHKISMEFLKVFLDLYGEEKLPGIIDLSADFRIKNIKLYEEFYGCKHILSELLEKFVYGLPEAEPARKQKIISSKFIANPGCYPTTAILGLSPIVSNYDIKEIIIDAKSGYSGGGKKLVEEYEGYGGNNTYPYNVYGKHRHIPEIKEQLLEISKKEINFLFTPYVVPQYQGMLTTIYIKAAESLDLETLEEMYRSYYNSSPFIKILPLGKLPQTKNVIKTNFCEISFAKEDNSDWIKIFVAIDNLIKGAVGQAVQNMNLMFGFDETEGLINI